MDQNEAYHAQCCRHIRCLGTSGKVSIAHNSHISYLADDQVLCHQRNHFLVMYTDFVWPLSLCPYLQHPSFSLHIWS